MLTVLIVNVLTVPEMVSPRLMTNKSTRNVFNDYTILRNKTMTSNIKDKKDSKQASYKSCWNDQCNTGD